MYTYNEIVDALNAIDVTNLQQKDRTVIRSIAEQLGYYVPTCNCKDKFGDLYLKLQSWVKCHPDGFCHYTMPGGVVRKGPDGNNIYNLNLTDAKAAWLLENDSDASLYLKQVMPFEDDKPTETVEMEQKQSVETPTIEKPKRGRKKQKAQ